MQRLTDLVPIPAEKWHNYKLHLATKDWDGKDPLEELVNSSFKEWQERQSKKNFQRKYIVALARYNNPDKWLFAGVYEQNGVTKVGDFFKYDTDLLDLGKDLIGRLVLSFHRTCRQPYLYLEKWADRITVVELARSSLAGGKVG